VKQTPMSKKIVYIDMDGVLVDLEANIQEFFKFNPTQKTKYKNRPDLIPNLFLDPPPIKGAIEAVNKLNESNKFELFIATAAPWGNVESGAHKRMWIETYFGELFKKKMFITHRKDMLMGNYLIDDRITNGAGEFVGEHLHFGAEKFPNWNSVVEYLLNEK
jgi:5'(3')-deoxyribonucleotidase